MKIDSRTKGQVAGDGQWKIIFGIMERYIKGNIDNKLVSPYIALHESNDRKD